MNVGGDRETSAHLLKGAANLLLEFQRQTAKHPDASVLLCRLSKTLALLQRFLQISQILQEQGFHIIQKDAQALDAALRQGKLWINAIPGSEQTQRRGCR